MINFQYVASLLKIKWVRTSNPDSYYSSIDVPMPVGKKREEKKKIVLSLLVVKVVPKLSLYHY